MSLKERLPNVLPLFREDSVLRVIIESIQTEVDEFRTDTGDVKDSLFIETAEGQSLDLIGDEFGIIGQRRGRDDTAFRQFLQGLVPAFDGRGTTSDVELAVAAGVTFDTDLVDLREDFSGAREYEVELLDSGWREHRTGTTRELAEIADPVAVDRIDPVYLFSEPAAIRFQATGTESGIETVSENANIVVDGAGTQSELLAIGLSSDDLGALSTQGFSLSTETV
jgi:hypothetical protein